MSKHHSSPIDYIYNLRILCISEPKWQMFSNISRLEYVHRRFQNLLIQRSDFVSLLSKPFKFNI